MKNIIRAIAICGALSALFILGGCGSGGWGGVSGVTVSTPAPAPASVSTYSLTRDDLNLPKADDLSTENNNAGGFILRAAESSTSNGVINANDVFRIDVLKQDQIKTGTPYDVVANPLCSISFFNCEKSSMLTTVSGTITFTKFGTKNNDEVEGTFDVTVEDGSVQYVVSGRFDYFLSFSI